MRISVAHPQCMRRLRLPGHCIVCQFLHLHDQLVVAQLQPAVPHIASQPSTACRRTTTQHHLSNHLTHHDYNASKPIVHSHANNLHQSRGRQPPPRKSETRNRTSTTRPGALPACSWTGLLSAPVHDTMMLTDIRNREPNITCHSRPKKVSNNTHATPPTKQSLPGQPLPHPRIQTPNPPPQCATPGLHTLAAQSNHSTFFSALSTAFKSSATTTPPPRQTT